MNDFKMRRRILILVLLIIAAIYTWLFGANIGILNQSMIFPMLHV